MIVWFAGWRQWSTPEAVAHVQELLSSYCTDTPPRCSVCAVRSEQQYYCYGCSLWTCTGCARVNTVTITKHMKCVDCTVLGLKDHRIVDEEPDFEWYATMARLAAGTQFLSLLGGTFRFRSSPIHGLIRWGRRWGLEVLPGSTEVYSQFVTHRLLVEGVSISTVELDFIAISVWHATLKAAIPGLWWHNPTKQDLVRVLLKHLTAKVKLSSKMTVPLPLVDFVTMINCLDRNDPIQLHRRIAMQLVGFGGLRGVAAIHLHIKRAFPCLYSLAFISGSNIFLRWDDEFGWCVAVYINFDKNIPSGGWRWVWIPGIMKCGLSLGDDIRKYLTTWPVPDGPLLAAPKGSRGRDFHTSHWTGLHRAVAVTYAAAFPGRPKEGISPYSLRKMIIQALAHYARATRKITNDDIGEYIGWVSKKTDIMKHYSGAEARHQMAVLADLDPAELPFEIVTSGVGPRDWS